MKPLSLAKVLDKHSGLPDEENRLWCGFNVVWFSAEKASFKLFQRSMRPLANFK